MTNQKKRAVTAMLLAALSFSLMGVFVKLSGDLPLVQKTLFRSAITLLIAWVSLRGQSIDIRAVRHRGLLLLRCIAGTLGILLNYYALDHLILSDANIILRLSTLFVVLLSWIFLKEKISRPQLLALGIAFLGILLVIKPSFSLEVIPFLVSLLGALSAAVAYTTLRALGGKEKPATIVFFFSLFSLVVLVPFVALSYVPMTAQQWFYLTLAGIFAGGGQMGITTAYKLAPAKEISIYDYYGVVFSALLSAMFFGITPDPLSILGYCIIFGASYLVHKHSSHSAKVG